MRLLAVPVVSALACAIVACGLDPSGDADLLGDDGGGATVIGPDASLALDGTVVGSDAGNGGDGGASGGDGAGAVSHDSGGNQLPPLGDGAPSSCGPVEICGNGVDDNCNGLVDCADPACTAGWVCEAVPSGWSVVEYEENGQDPCTAGYGAPTAYVEDPSAPSGACTCGAGCSVTNAGTCSATFSGAIDNNTGACTVAFGPLPVSGGQCTKIPSTFPGLAGSYTTNGTSKALVDLPTWTGPGACAPAAPSPPGAATYGAQGEGCAESPTSAGGCSSGAVCAPNAAGSFQLCIASSGEVACPSVPNVTWTQHVVGSQANAISCKPCTCEITGGSCDDPVETLFTDPGCAPAGNGNAATPLTVNGQCDTISDGKGNTYKAYTFDVTPAATCATTGGGGAQPVTLADVTTICCAN